MHLRWFALSSLTLVLTAQEARPLKAPIARVRLHPDEAWVTRVGRIRVEEAGAQHLELSDLPQGLSLEDLQVNVKGPAGTRLQDVGLRAQVRVVTETAEWKRLEAESEALKDQQDALEAQREAAKQELAFLKALQSTHSQELSNRMTYTLPNAQSIVDFGKGLQTRLASLLQQEKRIQRELDHLREEQHRVQAEKAKRQGEQRQAPTVVSVDVATPSAGTLEVEVSYRQAKARWRPVYEARLAEDRSTLALILHAAVTQSTGESWAGVKVEISNARPSRSLGLSTYEGPRVVASALASMPKGRDLNRVGFLAPGITGTASISGGASMENQFLIDGLDVAGKTTILQSAAEPDAAIMVEASGLATTWSLEGSKDIPSDGEPHRFRVLSKDLQPRISLLTVPRLSLDVHQVARFEPPSQFPLFPHAQVTHYVGGQRLGASQLILPSAGQPFTFGFGPYKPLRASMKRVDRKEETVGTFSKEHQWTLRDVMEVANDGQDVLDIEVQDRVLKSEEESIRISSLPDTTAGFVEQVAGVRTWRLRLEPKQKGSVTVATAIRSPLNTPLQGID